MVTGSAVTWCYVSDMEASLRFYRDVLRLTPGHVSAHWSDLSAGTLRIGLHPGLGEPPVGGWRLGLTCDDLRGLRNAAEVAGVRVVESFHQTPGGVVLTLADPDGNLVQVVQPGSTIAELA